MTIFAYSSVYSADFDAPLVCHLVEITISHQVVIDLSQQSFSRNHDESLGPTYFVVFLFFLDELLTDAGDVLKGVKYGKQIGEGLPGPVVGVDDNAQALEVLLEGDGQGFGLDEGGLLEVVVVEEGDDLLLEGIVGELGLLGFGAEIMLPRIFVHERVNIYLLILKES